MARVHNIGFPGEPFKYLNKYKLLDWAKKKIVMMAGSGAESFLD